MHENSVIKTIAVLTVRFDNYIEIEYGSLFGFESEEGESNPATPRSALIEFGDH